MTNDVQLTAAVATDRTDIWFCALSFRGRWLFHTLPLAIMLSFFVIGHPSWAENWPQFRGPSGQGISTEKGLPAEWSATKNILWKVDLPGKGSSSPIIWGNRIFVTSFSGYGLDVKAPGQTDDLVRHLICLDRDTGKTLWKKDIPNRGIVRKCEGFMGMHGYASHTPVTDGKAIYCWFASHGAVAFDLDGSQLWQTEQFEMTPTTFGSGASPILYGDLVLINASYEGRVFVALNKKTGREVWRRERIGSYTTPVIAMTPRGPEMILNANNSLVAYDPRTGEDLWHYPREKRNATGYAIPSASVHDGIIYSHNGSETGFAAVQIGGRGDVSSTHHLWGYAMSNTVPSPVYVNGYLFANKESVLTCLRASDGKLMYKKRTNPRMFHAYSSPLAADGKIYLIDRYGHSAVVKAGPEFELLAANHIDDDKSFFNASPAVSDGKLFIRSQKRLYCIGKENNE